MHRAAVLGPELSIEARSDKLARVLLARYGVVTRASVEHEEADVDWTSLYRQFERMEMRGEIRRGYFVVGLPGVQFALPAAVEQLRAPGDSDEFVVLNAADPANVFGGEVPDEPLRFARVPSTSVVLLRGRPVLLAEENGERLTAGGSVAPEVIEGALRALIARPQAPRHLVVSQWNGTPVLKSEGRALLERLGFDRTPTGLERWANR